MSHPGATRPVFNRASLLTLAIHGKSPSLVFSVHSQRPVSIHPWIQITGMLKLEISLDVGSALAAFRIRTV